MSVLGTLLSKEPPEELFHYTSQDGLLGILRNRELWASKAIFMNDEAEFRLALDLARKDIWNRSLEDKLRDELLEDISSIESVNVFVCSFSEKGDLLSQWRGYCPAGAGYSLGFDASYVRSVAARTGFYLGKCTYKAEEQEEVVRELVDVAIEKRNNRSSRSAVRPETSDTHPVWQLTFQDALAFAAPLLKHESFSEEDEWRLISPPIGYEDPSFSHRRGPSHLVPFFKIRLSDDDEPISLSRVIIGPTPHPGLAEDAVLTLLGSLRVDCGIDLSRIPFRAW